MKLGSDLSISLMTKENIEKKTKKNCAVKVNDHRLDGLLEDIKVLGRPGHLHHSIHLSNQKQHCHLPQSPHLIYACPSKIRVHYGWLSHQHPQNFFMLLCLLTGKKYGRLTPLEVRHVLFV